MRQRNDVTLRDPAHLYPLVDFVSVFFFLGGGGGGELVNILMENNFLTLN